MRTKVIAQYVLASGLLALGLVVFVSCSSDLFALNSFELYSFRGPGEHIFNPILTIVSCMLASVLLFGNAQNRS